MSSYRIATRPGETGPLTADEECARITVVLGANGAGKTRFLGRLMEHMTHSGARYKILNIEGGRVVGNIDNVNLGTDGTRLSESPSLFTDSYRSSRSSTLVTRVKLALQSLRARDIIEKQRFADAVSDWYDGDQARPIPAKPIPRLELAFGHFSNVFPHIQVVVEPNAHLSLVQGDAKYDILSGSEGEKHAFSLICDILANDSDEEELAVFADEPELHLNPMLACRLWTTLEAALPNAQFVYATHCVSFAMRENIGSIFALDYKSNVRRLNGVGDLSKAELSEFLGAIPLILSASCALAVEGNDASFDAKFYPWLLGKSDIAVVPLGAKSDVFAETSRLGLWHSLCPQATIIGVVDRDFLPAGTPTSEQSIRVVTTEFHEAESYLCHPDLIGMLAFRVRGLDQSSVGRQALSTILQFGEANSLFIVARRAFARLSIRVEASLTGSTLARLTSQSALVDCMQRQIAAQFSRATQTAAAQNIAAVVDEEASSLRRAIDGLDVDTLLRVLPGKELLRMLLPLVGLSSVEVLLDACKAHLDPASQTPLQRLRHQVLAALG